MSLTEEDKQWIWAQLDAAIDRFGGRFSKIDVRFDRLDAYIQDFRTAVIHRLERIDSRLDGLSGTLASLDARLPALTR
jgi:hypothetical protein